MALGRLVPRSGGAAWAVQPRRVRARVRGPEGRERGEGRGESGGKASRLGRAHAEAAGPLGSAGERGTREAARGERRRGEERGTVPRGALGLAGTWRINRPAGPGRSTWATRPREEPERGRPGERGGESGRPKKREAGRASPLFFFFSSFSFLFFYICCCVHLMPKYYSTNAPHQVELMRGKKARARLDAHKLEGLNSCRVSPRRLSLCPLCGVNQLRTFFLVVADRRTTPKREHLNFTGALGGASQYR